MNSVIGLSFELVLGDLGDRSLFTVC